MEQTYNIRLTLGGIGMLIYGMVLMEEVIKKLVKSSLQEKLEHYTKNKWNSFLLGIGATALTQSSSLISLLLLVFVGAGIIALPSAIAVIIGSNIGTTFSSMIIALLGFGKFSITAFAFPLIAVGGVGLLFFKDKKRRYYLKLLLSFGLLFFGIDLIKDSVEMLKTVIDFSQYARWGVVGFFFLGVVMTAIIQSSHTVVIMTLAALHGSIITFPMALGIVIGSNIGTTITVIFASLGGSRAKKNVAYAHLGFNCILSIIGLLYYPGITWIVTEGMGLQDNPIIALAVFNTVLNAITACVVLPFLGQFVNYVTSYTKKQQENTEPLHCERIQGSESLTNSFPIITLRALHLDSKKILIDSCRYTLQLFDRDIVTKEVVLIKKQKNIKNTLLNKLKTWFSPSNEQLQTILPTEESIEERTYNQQLHRKFYDETKQSIEVVLPTLLQLEQQELSEHEHHKQEALEGVINNSIEVMKYGKAIWEDIEKLRNAKGGLQDYYKDRQDHIENLCKKILDTINNKELSVEEFREMFGIEKSLYKLQRANSKKFLETISQKTAGTIPLSTLFNIERHILYIEKFLIKSWKAWGKSQPGHESGFTTFVHDLYDDGLLASNEVSNNE